MDYDSFSDESEYCKHEECEDKDIGCYICLLISASIIIGGIIIIVALL